jgi:VWFA-related protein
MIRVAATIAALAVTSAMSLHAVRLTPDPANAWQQPTFSTRTESVRVDVLVTEGAKVVTGLGPADFEIRDEGVLQTVDLVNFQQLPLHVVLALDLSYSVSGERLEDLRSASHALLAALAAQDSASLLTFNHAVSRRSAATSDIAALRSQLGAVSPEGVEGPGGTALGDATYASMLTGNTEGRRSLALIFSDGVDTGSWLSSRQVLDTARRTGVVVYGVSVRGSGGDSLLEEISEITGGDTVEADSSRNLRSAFIQVLENFRNRYLVSYSPKGVPGKGWHRLDVRIKGRRVNIKARPGYVAD